MPATLFDETSSSTQSSAVLPQQPEEESWLMDRLHTLQARVLTANLKLPASFRQKLEVRVIFFRVIFFHFHIPKGFFYLRDTCLFFYLCPSRLIYVCPSNLHTLQARVLTANLKLPASFRQKLEVIRLA